MAAQIDGGTLTLRLGAVVGILVGVGSQVLDLLVGEAAVRVDDGVFVGGVGQHAVFLALAALDFFEALLDALRRDAALVDGAGDAEIRAASRANNAARALVRAALIADLSRQTLPLAVDTHILRPVWRLAVGDGDGVAVRLTSAHGTSIEISAVALAFCLR